MPIYSRVFTVPAGGKKEFTLPIEGDVITYVRLRYPPGPMGLLKVAVFYGIKQIFPYEEGTWFYGNDEIIEWEEYWTLPEERTTLTIKAENDDDTYDHSFYLIINVRRKEDTLAGQIARSVAGGFRRVLGWI